MINRILICLFEYHLGAIMCIYFYNSIASLCHKYIYYIFSGKCSGGTTFCAGSEQYLGKFYLAPYSCATYRYYSLCNEFTQGITKTANGGFIPIYPLDSYGDGIANFEDPSENKNLGRPDQRF